MSLLSFTGSELTDVALLAMGGLAGGNLTPASDPHSNRTPYSHEALNRRRTTEVTLHLLAEVVVVFFALLVCSNAALAKTEYREIAWVWQAGNPGYTGEYETLGAAVDGSNSSSDQDFAKCLDSPAMEECHSGCTKINHYNFNSPVGQLVNGQYKFLFSTINRATSIWPACGARPGGTSTQDPGGPIAAEGWWGCPQQGNWFMYSGPVTYVIVNGVQTESYQYWCQREIPDPPSCKTPKPQFGNPIDPIDQTKNEAELDYASRDGLLRVRRFYTSAGGGRWTWGDVGIGFLDFTGRNSSRPPDVGSLIGTVKAYPSRAIPYSEPPWTAYVDTPRPFPLLKSQPDVGQKEVWIFHADGTRAVYTENPTDTFTTTALDKSPLSVATLPSGSVQWMLKSERDGFYVFDNTGSLVQQALFDGKTLSYQRQGNTLTVSANPGGRSLVYIKDPASGQYASATLPDGQRIGYGVDSLYRVASVTYPDSHTKTYLYNEAAYTGTTTSTPGWLTGIIDENQVRQSTFTYDGSNPIATERAGGVDKYSVHYNDPRSIGSATVAMPNNSQTILAWEPGPDGERRMLSQSQPAGSGCSAASNAMAYDSNGNVASSDDFNGNRTCYASDLSRNLETARVEGLAKTATCSTYTAPNAALPAGSRKVSTRWHPDWRIETQRAEPGKLTTLVYNGQADPFNGNAVASCAPDSALLPDGKPIAVLCKRVEQASTDANGASGFNAALQGGTPNRVASWTYNAYGQVLTATDPLNHTTTYSYYTDTTAEHTMNDLQSVTNALGQVTQITAYDPNGNPLSVVDPNGAVTTLTYDPRQRLTSRSVGNEVTGYQYDAAGQLLKATLPDGSYLAYSYDPARRLTGISDTQGNQIVYTLDAMGNRINEQVKDPSGTLARQTTRIYDALNRLQQITGGLQ